MRTGQQWVGWQSSTTTTTAELKNIKARLSFTRKLLYGPQELWEKIMTEETKVELLGSCKSGVDVREHHSNSKTWWW